MGGSGAAREDRDSTAGASRALASVTFTLVGSARTARSAIGDSVIASWPHPLRTQTVPLGVTGARWQPGLCRPPSPSARRACMGQPGGHCTQPRGVLGGTLATRASTTTSAHSRRWIRILGRVTTRSRENASRLPRSTGEHRSGWRPLVEHAARWELRLVENRRRGPPPLAPRFTPLPEGHTTAGQEARRRMGPGGPTGLQNRVVPPCGGRKVRLLPFSAKIFSTRTALSTLESGAWRSTIRVVRALGRCRALTSFRTGSRAPRPRPARRRVRGSGTAVLRTGPD